jgi:hypothetical protein
VFGGSGFSLGGSWWSIADFVSCLPHPAHRYSCLLRSASLHLRSSALKVEVIHQNGLDPWSNLSPWVHFSSQRDEFPPKQVYERGGNQIHHVCVLLPPCVDVFFDFALIVDDMM